MYYTIVFKLGRLVSVVTFSIQVFLGELIGFELNLLYAAYKFSNEKHRPNKPSMNFALWGPLAIMMHQSKSMKHLSSLSEMRLLKQSLYLLYVLLERTDKD